MEKKKKKTVSLYKLSQFFCVLIFIPSCIAFNGKKLEVKTTLLKKRDLKATLTSVNVANNQLTINGSGFSNATVVKIKGDGIENNLAINSQSDSQIVTIPTSSLSLLIGKTFDLIIGTADAQVSYTVTFTLQDGAITASHLSSMGATTGQILKYNGTSWAPANLASSQVYIGTWNASTNSPNPNAATPQAGDYYIVSMNGTQDLGAGATVYNIGDWIMYNGTSWDKIANSDNLVTSFKGRTGIVVPAVGDYTWSQITKTGSKLEDIADINITGRADGKVIKWSAGSWVMGDDNSAAGGIALTNLSASSPLSYNSGTGAFSLPTANVLGLTLDGLTSNTGAIAATDSILGAFRKLMNTQSDYISKSSGATVLTGTIAVSGTGLITIPTAPLGLGTPLEAANVTYVDNAIGANGIWNKSGATINYTAGNVGIGTTTPNSKLTVNGNMNIATYLKAGITNQAQIGGDLSAINEIPAGAYLFSTSASLSLLASSGSATPGDKVVIGYFSGITGKNALEVPNVASGSSNLLLMKSGGNVGIGTTTPASTLDVNGILTLESNGANNGQITVPSSGGMVINNGANATFRLLPFFDDIWIQNTNTSGNIQFSGLNGADLTGNILFNTTGNVGIGTTTPTQKLEINGNIALTPVNSKITSSTGLTLEETGDIFGTVRLSLQNRVGVNGALLEQAGSQDLVDFVFKGLSNQRNIRFENRAGASFVSTPEFQFGGPDDPTFIITDNASVFRKGNVGIGTTSPSYNLHVVGTAGLSTGTAWTNASDRRLKDIHGDYEYGLDEILKLHPVRYSYKKDNPLGLPSDFNKTGFIAQEVQKVIPDAVSKREDGFLELNVDPIHWAVVNAIKDLYHFILGHDKQLVAINRSIAAVKANADTKISELEIKNAKLEAENKEMKARLNKIEKMLLKK
jgi:hypothetical protein